MFTIAERLAGSIINTRWAHLPHEAIQWAKMGITDTIAVTLAGAGERCTRIALSTPGVAELQGPALVFGHGRRTSVLDAVLINGIASHALDYDDVNNHIGGHPSIPLVPAIFALGDMFDISGRDALLAYIIGFETETRIGRGVNHFHYERGWHPTATLGIFGTVAVSGMLLGLDQKQLANALALATSLASGVKANFGTMTKPLHVGNSLRNGVTAVFLAKEGFTANTGAFEHHQGFFDVFNGTGNHDIEKGLAEWGNPWNVVATGPNLKQFPCCGSTHGAINAALVLREAHDIPTEDILGITVLTAPRRLPHTDNPDPKTGLEAKFSIQYVVARALTDGVINLSHFEGAAYQDDAPHRLIQKIKTGVHPDMEDPKYDGYDAEVIISMSDGRHLSHRSTRDVLRGPNWPMTEAEMFKKFSDCSARILPKRNVKKLFDLLSELEDLETIAAVSAVIESGCVTVVSK